jgi:hypothetical protein
MRNEALATQPILTMTENRATGCQSSGQSRLELSEVQYKALALICVLGISCTSWAKTDQTSWANLTSLQAGEKIQVVDMGSKKHAGIVVSVSDTAITYRDNADEQTLQKQDVRSVKLMRNKHRLRNTFIVGGVGAGVGAAIGAGVFNKSCVPDNSLAYSFCEGFRTTRGEGSALIGAIGLVGGAVVGALLPSHETIYRVEKK